MVVIARRAQHLLEEQRHSLRAGRHPSERVSVPLTRRQPVDQLRDLLGVEALQQDLVLVVAGELPGSGLDALGLEHEHARVHDRVDHPVEQLERRRVEPLPVLGQHDERTRPRHREQPPHHRVLELLALAFRRAHLPGVPVRFGLETEQRRDQRTDPARLDPGRLESGVEVVEPLVVAHLAASRRTPA